MIGSGVRVRIVYQYYYTAFSRESQHEKRINTGEMYNYFWKNEEKRESLLTNPRPGYIIFVSAFLSAKKNPPKRVLQNFISRFGVEHLVQFLIGDL